MDGSPADASPEEADPLVTNTHDSGPGSLRQAILTANANPGFGNGADRISFDIASGPFVISPDTPLPEITTPVIIDGTTEPGYQNAPLVQLDGSQVPSGGGDSESGLVLSAGGSTVQGLDIKQIPGSGIVPRSKGGNLIRYDAIGTSPTGQAGLGNGQDGITIEDSPRNTIGGPGTGAGNLISGNALAGVRIEGRASSGNLLAGNTIGASPSGTAALANQYDGVLVSGAPDNTIGGANPSARNLISGNHFSGVRLTGAGASGELIEGNFIGTDVSGKHPLGNGFDGVFIDQVPENTIGGTIPGAGNLISGNDSVGLQIYGAGASGNQVLGNFIGTDVVGKHPLGNALDGVFLNNAPGNTVGGITPGAGNLITGNGSSGVQLLGRGAADDVVQGNLIGTDIFGRPRKMGNSYGLFENGATIGDPGSARNIVVGNRRANVTRGDGSIPSATTLHAEASRPVPSESLPGSIPPIVSQANTTVAGSFVTGIVLHLRQPIDPGRATDLSHYVLRLPGSSGGFSGISEGSIPLRSAVYDPSTQTVTLTLESPVSTSLFFQLSISGLADASVRGAGADPAEGHLLLSFGRVAPGQPASRGVQTE